MSAALANPATLSRDVVTLEVAGQDFSGWTDVKVTRGIEQLPSHFILRVTERLPGEPKMFPVDPGSKCKLMIGPDTVVTGFIDSYTSQISARGHEVVVIGRSKIQEIVDCAAGFERGRENMATLNIHASSLLQLAKDLCRPLDIQVSAPDGEGDPLVSIGDGTMQITAPLGATPWDILEPKTRWRRLIMLDGTDGNLILAKVGKKKAASGFSLPGNIIEARISFSKQDRYTVFLPVDSPIDRARDVSAALNMTSSNFHRPVYDEAAFKDQPRWDGQPRYRPHVVISDQNIAGIIMSENLAEWEKARRFGRSQALTATVALWRDSAGKLWEPNTLADVDAPALKLSKRTWLIAQVVYVQGFGTGTRSTVTLMPKEAFDPQPTLDMPFDPEIAAAQAKALQQRQRDGRRDQG